MTFLFVTENLGSGGAERQLTRLAVLFKNAGHNVCVVTWGSKQFHEGYLCENGVEHIMIPDYPKIKRVTRLAKLFRNRNPYAVISYLPMANETAILARWLARVPHLIVSERSFTNEWHARTRLRYFLYRFANTIVANSNNEAENIRAKVPALANKTIAIPNLVEIDNFIPSDKTKNAEDKSLRLVSVGRIIATKNILAALYALKKTIDAGYDCTLDWYGDTYDNRYATEVEQLKMELGLSNRFNLHGATTEIAHLLPDYDIFFFPSLLEGYPNVLCEAMACGLPVLSSNACEMPYIVDDGKGGILFDPFDIDAMAHAMCKIFSMKPEIRKAMGVYNRAKVVSHNSPQIILNKYLKLI